MANTDKRRATVTGLYKGDTEAVPFTGVIEFELDQKYNLIGYWWRLTGTDAQFLGLTGHTVALKNVPTGIDPFEHALEHAIEGLRRYRSNRRTLYDVLEWHWQQDSSPSK